MAEPDRTHVTPKTELNKIQPSGTNYELAFAGFIDRFLNIPAESIKSVWNPDTCPLSHLPWLAWNFRVPEWNPQWDEATKRAVIKASPDFHRKAVTRYALDAALKPIDLNIKTQEWFEYGGLPYRFKLGIDLTGSDRVWGPNDIKIVVNTALKAKNVRSFLEDIGLQRDLRNPGILSIGAFTQNVTTVTLRPPVLDHLNLPRPYIWTAAKVVSALTITVKPRP